MTMTAKINTAEVIINWIKRSIEADNTLTLQHESLEFVLGNVADISDL